MLEKEKASEADVCKLASLVLCLFCVVDVCVKKKSFHTEAGIIKSPPWVGWK